MHGGVEMGFQGQRHGYMIEMHDGVEMGSHGQRRGNMLMHARVWAVQMPDCQCTGEVEVVSH